MMEQTTTKKDARPTRRRIIGMVRSDKGDQTIKVVVNYLTRHPLYGKFLRRSESPYDHFGAGHAGTSIWSKRSSTSATRATRTRC